MLQLTNTNCNMLYFLPNASVSMYIEVNHKVKETVSTAPKIRAVLLPH